MSVITFENINHYGSTVFENESYIHNHNPELLLMYDCNYLQFKENPTLSELIQAEDYLRAYHQKYNQKHLKFYFPENEIILPEVREYLFRNNYLSGRLELYWIHPNDFPSITVTSVISVLPVTMDNIDTYLKLQYELDYKYGLDYADQRQAQHKRNFQNECFKQLIAFYLGTPAGTVDLIITKDTLEIDSLVVLDDFQKKGIGSRIQRYVMDHFKEKTVILVASGEDTPREMYKKQNYHYQSFKYEVMKVEE